MTSFRQVFAANSSKATEKEESLGSWWQTDESFTRALPRFAMLRIERENAANFLDSLRVLMRAMT